jgi:hypothetical protein
MVKEQKHAMLLSEAIFQEIKHKARQLPSLPLSGINKLLLIKFRKYMLLFVSSCLCVKFPHGRLKIKHKDTKTQRGACTI